MSIHSPTGENLNKLSGAELISIKRLAQMLDTLNDELVNQGFTSTETVIKILTAATPELTREAFYGTRTNQSNL
jgi:hypothetical protein